MDPEKVAYWYLRLNGFLLWENFYVHPGGGGGALTDADLIGVRFPFRAERLIDDPEDLMEDDVARLGLISTKPDLVMAEVKRGPCALNGPWTDPAKENIQRVIAAIGCLPTDAVANAGAEIYADGMFENASVRARLICVGASINDEMRETSPAIYQITWSECLAFIFQRFTKYARQKAQTELWEQTGRALKTKALSLLDEAAFVEWATKEMGVSIARVDSQPHNVAECARPMPQAGSAAKAAKA